MEKKNNETKIIRKKNFGKITCERGDKEREREKEEGERMTEREKRGIEREEVARNRKGERDARIS